MNALHFKAEWEQKFERYRTQSKDLYIGQRKRVKVIYMGKCGQFKLANLEDLDAKALELKYKALDHGTSYSLFIILPNKRMGLPALESHLKNYDFKHIINKSSMQEVDVVIPKFKIEF